MKFKYIILQNVGCFFDCPIIFPTTLQHDMVSSKFGGKDNVVSAGFVSIQQDSNSTSGFNCHGESVSLKKQSKVEDGKIIKRFYDFE